MKHKTESAKTDQEHREQMRKDPWYQLSGKERGSVGGSGEVKLACRVTILPDQVELWRAWLESAPIAGSTAQHVSALTRLGLRAWAKERGL